MGTPGLKGMKGGPGEVFSGGASIYVNWGRNDCPASSTTVYSGRAVAPVFDNAGGGAQYLCIQNPPDNGMLSQTSAAGRSTLVGAHFETFSESLEFLEAGDQVNLEPLNSFDGNAVVCAVCMSPNSGVMMIPNNQDCPTNDGITTWTMEYTGYLMAARDYIFLNTNGQLLEHEPVFGNTLADGIPPPHFRTEYICVNNAPINIGGNSNTEALLSHIRVYCRGLAGLDDISCLEFFDFSLAVCPADDRHCALGPLGCVVCSASAFS